MLTHGKKIWGIWRISIQKFMCNFQTGSIEVYDDYQVILADFQRYEGKPDYQIREISNGD